MSNEQLDPSGNTGQFKAFAQAPPEEGAPSRAPLVIGVAVAVVVLAVVAYLALS
ncbi:hypothetical protein [Planosporangium mesophilum]|jgi:hypothetical protein|uniref:Uncharacterized protein n=1 Tax=Planosporangium mesophilum TaxID=689768 RepID=A0A8J3WZB9_9ACTN|nr:hypothetical protein [Planosporangium mesophilum]NJC81313.1 hypothetical protein [Planosporangium mesophilum]GII21034.1 hypothetical protein Pme01_06310 [Planosporangium mesophilum]